MSVSAPNLDLRERFAGLLRGTAVGDALGLPAENLSADQIRLRWKGQWKMRFIFGRGMVSDDTEHTLMVVQALLEHPDNATAFQRALAWKFRWWCASLPGGVGLATAKACIKLWMGFLLTNVLSSRLAVVRQCVTHPSIRILRLKIGDPSKV